MDEESEKCCDWLNDELEKHEEMKEVKVRTTDQFKGSETETIVWVGFGWNPLTSLDSVSRASSRLVMVYGSGKDNLLAYVAVKAVKAGKAKWAEEQKDVYKPNY